jgi:hypothetical protein
MLEVVLPVPVLAVLQIAGSTPVGIFWFESNVYFQLQNSQMLFF